MADGRRNNGGHSTKGKAGRPSKADELKIKKLTDPHIEKAIKTVIEIMANGDKSSDRLAAAKVILEYNWGKPSQMVYNDNETNHMFNIPMIDWIDGSDKTK